MVIYTATRDGHEACIYVPIESVRMNRKKLRKLSSDKISRYAYGYEAGDELPPISVTANESYYTIRDGRHRYQAQLLCGYLMVAVYVVNPI